MNFYSYAIFLVLKIYSVIMQLKSSTCKTNMKDYSNLAQIMS